MFHIKLSICEYQGIENMRDLLKIVIINPRTPLTGYVDIFIGKKYSGKWEINTISTVLSFSADCLFFSTKILSRENY